MKKTSKSGVKKSISKIGKSAPKKKAVKKRKGLRPPASSARRGGRGLNVPLESNGVPEPLPTSKLEKGLAEAKLLIRDMVHELAAAMGDDAELTEVGCVLSFSADGKFLGVGVGGATSLRCKFRIK